MYYYFSAEVPSALKLNGIYYGIIGDTVKSINIDEPSTAFAEIIPLNGKGKNVNLLLDENNLKDLSGIIFTDLSGGYLIKVKGEIYPEEFKVIAQEKYPDALITVFNENGLKLSLESPLSFYSDNFEFYTENVKIKRERIDGRDVLSLLFDGKILAVYSLDNAQKRLFLASVEEFSFQNGFTTTQYIKDIAKHKITSAWKIEKGELKEKERKITRSDNYDVANLTDKILPYAFLEELSARGDVNGFLTEKMQKNANKIYDYLGNFLGIMPPPIFRSIDEIGLIYKVKENRYKVNYVSFELKDGKIDNIKRQDD